MSSVRPWWFVHIDNLFVHALQITDISPSNIWTPLSGISASLHIVAGHCQHDCRQGVEGGVLSLIRQCRWTHVTFRASRNGRGESSMCIWLKWNLWGHYYPIQMLSSHEYESRPPIKWKSHCMLADAASTIRRQNVFFWGGNGYNAQTQSIMG